MFVFDGPPMRVEHVRVTVDITHLNRGQLQIELQSPGGMRSRLAERHTDRNDDWEFWTFGSRRHWAETSSGTWTLEIRDMVARLGGRLNYARVELLGTLLGGAEFVEAQWNEAPGLGTPDGIISPGETIEEHVTFRNVDSTDLEGVRVEWFETSQTGVVEMLNSSVELGKVPVGQLATNGIPLSYRVAKLKALCGQTLEFACVSTANGVRATNRIFRRIGIVPGEAKTEEFVATVGLPLTVIDRGTVMATNHVDTVEGLIDDVRVWVRMDHPTVGDTQMSLIHPDGTEILLAQNRGGNNPDMGVGNCVGGTPLQFSDSAAMSIRKGEAPFAGSFQPDEPLATFRGKLAAGDWRLRISDVYDEDSGVLRCWGLTITSRPLLTSCEIFSMPSGVEILGFSPTVEGGFRIIGKTPNVGRVLLEASTDLVTWEAVAEATPSDVPFEMIDPNAGGAGGRFYRLRVP
jgi:subtilisin-like proprotein convertase family protein